MLFRSDLSDPEFNKEVTQEIEKWITERAAEQEEFIDEDEVVRQRLMARDDAIDRLQRERQKQGR